MLNSVNMKGNYQKTRWFGNVVKADWSKELKGDWNKSRFKWNKSLFN